MPVLRSQRNRSVHCQHDLHSGLPATKLCWKHGADTMRENQSHQVLEPESAMITPAQFHEMEMRLSVGKQKPTVADDAVDDESELHKAILDDCKRRGWLCFHGSMAHRTHRTKGEPDMVIAADYGRVFFIEAKAKKGKVSTEQAGTILWLTRLGHTAAIVRNMVEYLQVINRAPHNPHHD